MSKRIAILGAGFCGLACAWHLLQHPEVEIVIFDPKGIGQGASGVAAGLLHPYVGAHSKYNWRGAEGMAATLQLLKIAEKALGEPVHIATGLLRPVVTAQQAEDFARCAEHHSDVHWRSAQENALTISGLQALPGIFIENALVVDTRKYLEGLWLACQTRIRWEQRAIGSLVEVEGFDSCIVAIGSSTRHLPELKTLPINVVKGQILEFTWPEGLPPLPYPVNSQAYLLMHPSHEGICIAGATYERRFDSLEPDPDVALNDILPKIRAFFPKINRGNLLSCRAGARATAPYHRPWVGKISEKAWVLTGMGSRGLLYHALYAEQLSLEVLKD